MHAPTHPNMRKLCTLHTCTHLSKHAHNMCIYICACYIHARAYCACYIHAPPTLIFACCARYIHAHIYTTCAYCARYMHAQTHPYIRMLCTIHTCNNLPKHAYCARYIHAPTHPNICMLCTLHTWWYMHTPTQTPTHPNMRILCMMHTCTRPVKHAHIVNATYMHHPP